MDPVLISTVIILFMFLLLAIGLPIGFAMGTAGTTGCILLVGFEPAMSLMGNKFYETPLNYVFSVLPLFILMGAFAAKAGISQAIYRACYTWFGYQRGGLALATIGSCGLFAAISGSSLATAATMTSIALPEMKRYGYDDKLSTGSIAAGGTVGILIPPSVLMVIYGLLTETSIGQLFVAGILPGILLVLIYMITVAIVTAIWPHMGPRGEKTTFKEKILAFKDVGPTMLLFILVIGGIYSGTFSPEEAAGIGASGALAIGVASRTLNFKAIFECLMESVKTTSMVFTILFGALLFNDFLVLSDLTRSLSTWIEGLPFPPVVVIIVILCIYLVLGCALDTLAMVLLTVPIFFPVILNLGYDRVWFGIIVVLVVELGLITPPIGMNVFVISGMAKDVPLIDIFKGVTPFVFAQVLIIAIVLAWPNIALILPHSMNL